MAHLFPKSIQWRLQAWQGFLLVCVLTGFGFTAYHLQRLNHFRQIDDELDRRLAALNSEIVARPPFGPPHGSARPDLGPGPGPLHDGPGGPGGPRGGPGDPFDGRRPPDGPFENRTFQVSPATQRLFDPSDANGFYYLLWSRSGTLIAGSTNAPANVVPPAPRTDTLTHIRVRQSRREAYHFTEIGECILAGRSIRADLDILNRFAGFLVVAGGTVLTLGLGDGAWLIRHAFRPLNAIGTAAHRIAAGNLSERIPVGQTDDELARLAGVLNATFARLEAAFALQRQFVADASHEMRTPMTVLITEAQATLARTRTAEEYRETLKSCLDTAQQLRRLTESLLQLAQLDAGQESFQHQPCDLADIARACVERLRPLVAERGLRIECDLLPSPACGDAGRLGQVVTNLLSNAVVYNRDRGSIRVRCGPHADGVCLSVADTGIGIAPEHLPRIFDRFYRVDPSRSGAPGRTGLGLAITKAIVEAHGGTITVTSESGVGTEFIVRLPAATPGDQHA